MFYFNRQLDKFHVEGSETAQQVLDRYIPALKRVAAENDGKTIAIFSHGAAMRMVLGTLNGLPLSQVGETPHGDNTAVSLLEIDGDTYAEPDLDHFRALVGAAVSEQARIDQLTHQAQ